ncbi:MAG: helix-turn-helix domain-containing protein [Candidatus Korobacteraceae bacterium]
MATQIEELMTVNEIAALLKVPPSWVYERARRRGRERIPHVKLGKYLRFSVAEVGTWVQSLREI